MVTIFHGSKAHTFPLNFTTNTFIGVATYIPVRFIVREIEQLKFRAQVYSFIVKYGWGTPIL